ncbi:ATP-binding cassette domain-containing protein [Ancylobacter lacus]|uniref:ATP-binding cassette domain-containing protein n=1 Tax=Ancylobacter lacus TaxID=2579970 RepID=UPI001BCFA249|nr:ATP-binding cassette domain-containing protein [Ancylobacter lacus]MBS7539532.1 ATP-binding cassette domain-containing protein [Ancylobacter lacus]
MTAFASVAAEPVPSAAGTPHGLDLRINRLSRQFGDKRVLERLDLTIPAGQFVAVIGKSGCGKSTLLRLIGGLDQPSGGDIAFEGRNGPPADREAIRLMFQEPRLLPWQRVGANVEVGLPARTPPAERAARARALLGEVGLADRAGEWPAVLSGGQKQRVALARALASRPRLLALDEPLGALDALTRIEMQGLIERIWLEQRFTALLVTHDVAEALALADRVILLDQGRIAFDLDVPLPRPRRRGSAELAALEERLLTHLFAG